MWEFDNARFPPLADIPGLDGPAESGHSFSRATKPGALSGRIFANDVIAKEKGPAGRPGGAFSVSLMLV